jgi:hypothetical protein
MKSHGVMRPTYNEWRDYINALVRQLYADKEIETPLIHPNHMVEVVNFLKHSPVLSDIIKAKIKHIINGENYAHNKKN